MKAAMADLIFLNGKDEALYQELAGDLDEEWVKMDLQGSKKIREEQGIPEQYLWNPEAKDASAWPFPSKGAGAKPAEPVVREYRYHAFDGELPRGKWTDEEVSEEELERQQDYSVVDNDIAKFLENDAPEEKNEAEIAGEKKAGNGPKPVEQFMNREWDKIAGRTHMYQNEKEACLSRLMAADALWSEGNDDPSEQQIDERAAVLRKTGNFKLVGEYVNLKDFARTRRVDLIEKCARKAAEQAALTRSARLEKLRAVSGPAAESLLATRSGKSYFFGLPRFITGNSTRYENALGAIQTVQHTVPPDPKKVSDAADTVKEYLRDKMTRRKREFLPVIG